MVDTFKFKCKYQVQVQNTTLASVCGHVMGRTWTWT